MTGRTRTQNDAARCSFSPAESGAGNSSAFSEPTGTPWRGAARWVSKTGAALREEQRQANDVRDVHMMPRG